MQNTSLLTKVFCFLALLFLPTAHAQRGEFENYGPRSLQKSDELEAQGAMEDRNIDYSEQLKYMEPSDLPKPYRHPFPGVKHYRPNFIATGYGGRFGGAGALLNFNFNRVFIGSSAGYLPEDSFQQEFNNTNLRGQGKFFSNIYAGYHIIPFAVSPYFLIGVEYAVKTKHQFDVLAGAGIDFRLWRGLNLLLEYIRHETDKNSHPGVILGWAF